MEPVAILSLGTQIMSFLRSAAEALKAAGKPEAVGGVVEAQLAMMDLLQKHQALLDENRSLRDRLREAEEALEHKGALIHRHSAYWKQMEDGTLDGPFAASMWDRERRLVRMQRHNRITDHGIVAVRFIEPTAKDSIWVPVPFMEAERCRVLNDEMGLPSPRPAG